MNSKTTGPEWKVSLHGGHSGEFCEHARGSLRETIEAAVAAGYRTFGVSEHAPRREERLLYASEREKGYDVERLKRDFDAYAAEVRRLAAEYAGRITVLCGFEAEVVPAAGYRDAMLELQRRHAFDYMVGSVHHVHEIPIDGTKEDFDAAVESCGGLEALCAAYYELVAEMIAALQPQVVGHLDLHRRNAPHTADLQTPEIRKAAGRALEAAREYGAILDLNTAGRRKRLGGPYPAPRLLRRAAEMGIPFCFGDDSHGPSEVGAGIDEARAYLLENGVTSVDVLVRSGPSGPGGAVFRKTVSLQA